MKLLGPHIITDAAQHGSYAHRVRAVWTNLAEANQLQHLMNAYARQPNRIVNNILDNGRHTRPVERKDQAPRFPCNEPGLPMRALPTLMSHPYSYAFRKGKQGDILNANGTSSPPTPAERERALGYPVGCTAVGLTDEHRNAILGRCMDGFCMQTLWASMTALHEATPPVKVLAAQAGGEGTRNSTKLFMPPPVSGRVVEATIDAADLTEPTTKDIWEDDRVMTYLQTGTQEYETSAERKRIVKRASLYRWRTREDGTGGQLLRIFPDGTTRIVPEPHQRESLTADMHCRTGHFGVRRTYALLAHTYWWKGMRATAGAVCKSCEHCDRANATFTAESKILHPLPINGLFYRWGCDLAGPFPVTKRGNTFVMFCIEHYSKHVEAIPLPDRLSATTARAFLHHVLSKFGSCAEVVTDRGTEFQGDFAALLQENFIDHRITSAEHPQADGLAERCVQTFKNGLNKMTADKGTKDDWDDELAWVAFGYRASPQMSTGYSPFELLYARTPVVPPATRERLEEPVDFDDPRAAAASLLQRKEWVKQAGV